MDLETPSEPEDYSHIPLHDRPPAQICEGVRVMQGIHFQKGEDRVEIPQKYPGKRIEALKGLHSGKVALLYNGPSLANHDLWKIPHPLIGLNRTHRGYKTYSGPQPDYLCVVDNCWIDSEDVRDHPGLINGTLDRREAGYRATKSFRMNPFSFDLQRDGYVPWCPATTGHLAIQVAVYLGFTDIYCLGLDLSGPHYDGTEAGRSIWDTHRFFEKYAPVLKERDIKVTICGSPKSKVSAFPMSTFEDLLG